jgi:histidine kinase
MKEIEERKQAEEARMAAERELEQQRIVRLRSDRLRALGEMAAGIAHELNQPLVGVRGLAEHLLLAMERGWHTAEEKVRERLLMIVAQADRMSHIIEHVRLFSRGAGKPELEPVDVNAVVNLAMEMLGEQCRSHGVALTCELAENLPAVSANPFSLEEVILNLLLNARDAVEERLETSPGITPPHVFLRTVPVEKDSRKYVEIRVTDHGVGIPDNNLPKVFDPFFTTKSPAKGTGLGLPISRSIIEQFDGDITIESSAKEDDPGTVVTIFLPAQQAAGEV